MPEAPDLHVHSGFSTYDGMGSPESVAKRAVELGWGAVCLTEHGHMMSAPALYQAARKEKIKPIIGCEMYVTPEDYLIDGDKNVLKERRHLTVLALSFEGYQNLVKWVSESYNRPLYYNGPRISLERMAETAPQGLHHNVVLSGCLGGELCQCLLHQNGSADLAARLYLESAKEMFPNFYIELQNHEIRKFMGIGLDNYETVVGNQAIVRERLLSLSRDLDIPVIVTNDSHFQTQDQRRPHIAMLARKQHRRARDIHEAQATEATAIDFKGQYIYWASYQRPMEKIAASLPKWAEKEAIDSIHAIVEEANVTLEPLDSRSYTFPRSTHRDPIAEIRRRSKRRLKLMVARHGDIAAERFEHELAAMEKFADYLLIYSDIVQMARDQGIYTWTRGSACGSLVNFCLRIHSIDPIHYGLLFERFVNPARGTFPDVDIDFEAHRRDDVARSVKEYMAELGQEVLAIGTYTTTANRQAFRMMAEAAGLPKERVDELAKLLPQMIDSGMVTSEEEAYEAIKEELGLDIHGDAAAVFDAIAGVSQHACAFVIGTDDRPLSQWIPTYRIGSSDAVVTQYNMKWIEALGYLKLDLLKLDTLSIMHSVARQLGKDVDWLDSIGQSDIGIYDAPDEAAFELLRQGRTDGVFTFQGATQRRGCIEVQPETTKDLVHIQGIYRPSGTRTGLDKQYVNRKHEREEWEHLNEYTERHWDETFGLPIFQEQIMEMGFDLGMTGEEVDDLYKAIKTAKGVGRGAKELFEAFEPTFRKYADEKMSKEQADEIWARWDAMQGYCVTGDTIVEKGDGTKTTVSELHSIWHGPPTAVRKKYRSKHPKRGLWLTAWVDGKIKLDKCVDVIDNGVKPVWTVFLADGKKITATANHPLLTSKGWVVVGDLEIGDEVVIDSGAIKPYYQPSIHGRGWTGKVKERTLASDGRMRPVLHGHHAALSALEFPSECERCGANGVRLERAHLNHDRTDNTRDNVQMLCSSCHKKHDYETGQRQGRWSRGRLPGSSCIVNIEYAGEQRTFDLSMQGDGHNFIANGIVAHNTFNKIHATSFAILGKKSAVLLANHPREYYIALLERYPDNPRYIAAAIGAGFTFEPPCVNNSLGGFSRGSGDKSIRTGLLRVDGIGPGAAGEIVRNQPFASLDDLRARTNSQRVKAPTIEALAALGALEDIGIAGSADDLEQLRLLKMVLGRPKVFKGCKPQFPRRGRSSWEFTGLDNTAVVTEGKRFCAKLFWILPGSHVVTKTAPNGHWNAHLLTAVDVNGLPFDLQVSDKKYAEGELLKYLAKMENSVVCAEGQIAMPFERGANTGFKLWGITGAEAANPQMWHCTLKDAKKVIQLAQAKREQRRS